MISTRLFLLAATGLTLVGQTGTDAPIRLTLAEAEELAVRQSPTVAGARLDTQAGREAVREIRAATMPQLSGGATAVGAAKDSRVAVGALNAGGVFDRFATGMSGTQLISDFGRTNRLIASQKLHVQAQEAGERFVRASAILEADRAYYRALRAKAVQVVAKATVAARQTVSDQVTALAQSGLKSELDMRFANVNLADAKLLESAAQGELDEAFADLSAALGYPTPHAFDLVDAAQESVPEADWPSLLQEAMGARPDLAELRLDHDAAAKFTDAERALNRPTVSAAAAAGVLPFHDDRLTGAYAAAGVNVSIPILNGSLFSARAAEASYRERAALARVRDAEDRVARDAREAWIESNTAYQRIGLTMQLLEQADAAMGLAQARYDLGLSSIVELGQAQLGKTSAEIQNLTARYEYRLRSSVLRYELGRLR